MLFLLTFWQHMPTAAGPSSLSCMQASWGHLCACTTQHTQQQPSQSRAAAHEHYLLAMAFVNIAKGTPTTQHEVEVCKGPTAVSYIPWEVASAHC
jgi:hypothetical protein